MRRVSALFERVATDQEDGNRDIDAAGDWPDHGASIESRANLNEAVEIRKVVHGV